MCYIVYFVSAADDSIVLFIKEDDGAEDAGINYGTMQLTDNGSAIIVVEEDKVSTDGAARNYGAIQLTEIKSPEQNHQNHNSKL